MKPKRCVLPALATKQCISLSKPDSANGKMHALGFGKYRLKGDKRRVFWLKNGVCYEINNAESVHEFADSYNLGLMI